MGSWFSNFHVRKTEKITDDNVCDCIKDAMMAQECVLVEDAQDADFSVAVVQMPSSQWISVYSPVFAHDDPESCAKIISPISEKLHTDVLGIACFDSDYLYLNMINTEEEMNGWIGIGYGKEVGISRRNNVTAWKKKVKDYSTLSSAAKIDYPCAEEFLFAVEDSLELTAEQGCASLDYMQESELLQNAKLLHFQQAEGKSWAGPRMQIPYMWYALPCFDGRENDITFINEGDASQGLSIYFLGPYVEHEEIVFTNVTLKSFNQPPVDIALKKVQLDDGRWAYCYHDPEMILPPGVPRRMSPEKRSRMESERWCTLRFVPYGNPRMMLDITVMIVPDGYSENYAEWNILTRYGSKKAFIEHHNKAWKRLRAYETDPNQILPYLKLEDFEDE